MSSRQTNREIIHTQNKKDTIHAMQYKAKQSKQSKDQKRAKGVVYCGLPSTCWEFSPN